MSMRNETLNTSYGDGCIPALAIHGSNACRARDIDSEVADARLAEVVITNRCSCRLRLRFDSRDRRAGKR